MKSKLFLFAVLSALMMFAAAQPADAASHKASSLEISFNYQQQRVPGSNQWAVWIEDAQGQVVRTLFVTSFTTKGRTRPGQELKRGYTFRPACVPTWVSHVDAESLSDAEMDAVTGATPFEGGVQTYVWDFKDQAGKKVKKGSYKVYVEATLRDKSIVTYSGTFKLAAKAGAVALDHVYTVEDTTYREMISDVKATLK